jgi:hypothetical protein
MEPSCDARLVRHGHSVRWDLNRPIPLAVLDAKVLLGSVWPRKEVERMRRAILMVVALALFLLTMTGTGHADVHGVSQAGCGASSNAGAIQSRDAGGRPDAPIPVSASGGKTQGQGGAADAQGQNC